MGASVLFEGIATVDIDGVAHDTYMMAQVEVLDDVMVRWFGTLGWMGEKPKGLFHGEILDVVFSDGREGKIQIPHPSTEQDGKLEFQGRELPPGFQPLYQRAVLPPEYFATAELASTTPSRWRVFSARLLFFLATVLVVASIWWSDYRWESFGTGFLFSLLSIHLSSPGKGKQLKEIKSDDD